MMNARVLADRLSELLSREHAAMADFLVDLAEFDRRRGWEELGYASLFYFLHRELGLSTGAAHYRKVAAELMQKFPEIVQPLRDGRLCITSIVQLAKVLTPENCHDALPKFFQRSKREAMAVAAELQPAIGAPHREVVTALRAVSPPLFASAAAASKSDSHVTAAFHPDETTRSNSPPVAGGASNATEVPSTSLVRTPLPRHSSEPLTGELSRLHITVSRRFLDKLEAARDALSHARPGASAEAILEAGLDLVLKQQAKRKGLVAKPRKSASAAKASTLTAAVKRQVWNRDGGRCQWPLNVGGICGSTSRVEFDHSIARARGGPSTAKNMRLLCRVHNDLAARQAFGDHWNEPVHANPQRRRVCASYRGSAVRMNLPRSHSILRRAHSSGGCQRANPALIRPECSSAGGG